VPISSTSERAMLPTLRGHSLGTICSFQQNSSEVWEFRPSLRCAPSSYVSSNLKDQCPFCRLDARKSLFGRQSFNMPKQGKVRKGTHSCRECRRRKVKCVLEYPTDGKCVLCQRRGSTCTSQSVVDSSMTTPEGRGYTEGLHDETTIITDDDRDTQSATPALALHGRPEVGEQHPFFPGIHVPRVSS
jgi:hypothetical protein